MNYLAIECTHVILSVALKTPKQAITKQLQGFKRASSELLPLIQSLLTESTTNLSQVQAIMLSAGPGSFTALRIGMSIAKGLAFSHDIPLVLIPTLQALYLQSMEKSAHKNIIPVIHSKSDEFFYAAPEHSNQHESSLTYGYKTSVELVRELETLESKPIIAGRKVHRHFDEVLQNSKATIKCLEADFFDAASLFDLGEKLIQQQNFANLLTCSPLYLKEFEAKLSKKQPFLKNYFN